VLFVDSNIWCYYFDESAQEHGAVAVYIDSILGKQDLALNTLVVMELAHYLIKNLGPIKGKEKVEKLLAFPFVIEEFDHELLGASITMLAHYAHTGIGGRDAAILATMKKLGITKLVTHDKAFKKVDFITVIDPIT